MIPLCQRQSAGPDPISANPPGPTQQRGARIACLRDPGALHLAPPGLLRRRDLGEGGCALRLTVIRIGV